jgi:hypothetical protein
MGKHSKQGRRTSQRRTIATLELVDVTGTRAPGHGRRCR